MTSSPPQRRLTHHSLQQSSHFDAAYPSPPWSDEGTAQSAAPMYDYHTMRTIAAQVMQPYPASPITRCCSATRNLGYHEQARHYDLQDLLPDVQHFGDHYAQSNYKNSRQPQATRIASLDPRDGLRMTGSPSLLMNIKRTSSEVSSPSDDASTYIQMMPWYEAPMWTSTADNTSVMQPKPIHPPVAMTYLDCSESVTQRAEATPAHVTSAHATSAHATSAHTTPARTASAVVAPFQPDSTSAPTGLLHSMKLESATPSLQDFKEDSDERGKLEEDTKKDIQMRRSQYTDPDSTSFVCTKCVPPRGFVRRWNLTKHRETHDTEPDRPFKCFYTLCDMRFKRAHDLQRHIDGVHLKSKKFQCSLCHRGFPRKDSLQRHELHCCPDHRRSTEPPYNRQRVPTIDDAYAKRRKKACRRIIMKRERDQSPRPLVEPHRSSPTTSATSYTEQPTGFSTVWEDLTTSGLTYHVPELQSLGDFNQIPPTYWPPGQMPAEYSQSTLDTAVAEPSAIDWNTILGAYND